MQENAVRMQFKLIAQCNNAKAGEISVLGECSGMQHRASRQVSRQIAAVLVNLNVLMCFRTTPRGNLSSSTKSSTWTAQIQSVS